MLRKPTFLSTMSAALMMTGQVLANDGALYAEAPPEDASFVRFIGFEDSLTAEFAGRTFHLMPDEVSAYIPVSSASLEDVASGSFFTIVETGDGNPRVISEPGRDNRSKVFLFLVNGTETELDLRLADNSAPILENVPHNTSALRGVNPVSVSLGIFKSGTDTLLASFDVSLRRGQNISLIAGPDGYQLVENRFAAVAK